MNPTEQQKWLNSLEAKIENESESDEDVDEEDVDDKDLDPTFRPNHADATDAENAIHLQFDTLDIENHISDDEEFENISVVEEVENNVVAEEALDMQNFFYGKDGIKWS